MIQSHSNEFATYIEQRLNVIEQKLDQLLLLQKGDYTSTVACYSIRQAAIEVGCTVYSLKIIWDKVKPSVPPPIKGTRYSKQDIAKLREAYVKFKSHA